MLAKPLLCLDIETTGRSTTLDRIIEVAAIRCTSEGRIVETFSTILDPTPSYGAQQIHRIPKCVVGSAPAFRDICHEIFRLIEDSIVVSHVFPFDWGFLTAEARRLGIALPAVSYFCTAELAARALGTEHPRSLAALCARFGIPHTRPHEAEADALAVRSILLELLRLSRDSTASGRTEAVAGLHAVPPFTGIPLRREHLPALLEVLRQ